MSIEQNKIIALQLMEAHSEGNVARLYELFSSTFVWHIADVPQHLTREDYIQGVEMGRQAFSNLTFSIEDTIGEGEKVVLRITVRSRHTGAFQNIAPTGKQIEYTSVAILRIVDGKIAEEWLTNDQWKLFEQIDALPSPV